MRVNRNPLRRIVREERDERGVLMQHLDCGHSVTHHIDAGMERRRCPACGRGIETVVAIRCGAACEIPEASA